MTATERANLAKVQVHDHTSPTADGCALCEAFEGIEQFAPKIQGLSAAARRQKYMIESINKRSK